MVDNHEKQLLYERLARGPAYLLVGQQWLKSRERDDPFLAQALNKFEGPPPGNSGYRSLLESKASVHQQEAIEWLQHRCPHIPIPEAYDVIGSFGWNGVVTSAIDDVLIRAFQKPWREIQRVTTRSYQVTDPRSRTRLHIWFLFGCVSAVSSEGWPTPHQPATDLA